MYEANSSSSRQTIEAIFDGREKPCGLAITHFLRIVSSDSTPFEDVYEIVKDLRHGTLQPIFHLFTGKESHNVIQPVADLINMHLVEPEALSDQRAVYFTAKYKGQPDEELGKKLKPDYVQMLWTCMNEARQAIKAAVEFSHTPIQVQSLELIPISPAIGMKFTDGQSGETIVQVFNSYDITISSRSERIIDGVVWRTEKIEKEMRASECKKDVTLDLFAMSPSQSAFAKECLSKVRAKFIERNIHDCPWRRDFNVDGEAVHYPPDCMQTCLVLEGELPLMSRRKVYDGEYQNPVFADSPKA